MISHSEKFIYLDVCRTGGHSIRQVLSENFEVELIEGRRGDRRFTRHHTLMNLSAHRPYCTEVPLDKLDEYFKFSFVRNPFDRFASVYAWYGRNSDLSFEDFVFKFLVYEPEADGHAIRFIPQVYWMRLEPFGELCFDFLGRFEKLQEDFNLLAEKLGMPLRDLPVISRLKGDTDYRSFYNSDTRRVVENYYQEDLESFGYDF